MRRLHEHRAGKGSRFTARDQITRLVHCEETGDLRAAIAREKQIKGWNRQKKVALAEAANPNRDDLAAEWLPTTDSSLRSE